MLAELGSITCLVRPQRSDKIPNKVLMMIQHILQLPRYLILNGSIFKFAMLVNLGLSDTLILLHDALHIAQRPPAKLFCFPTK